MIVLRINSDHISNHIRHHTMHEVTTLRPKVVVKIVRLQLLYARLVININLCGLLVLNDHVIYQCFQCPRDVRLVSGGHNFIIYTL